MVYVKNVQTAKEKITVLLRRKIKNQFAHIVILTLKILR